MNVLARAQLSFSCLKLCVASDTLGRPKLATRVGCWRDARVAESDGLENRCGCTPTVGSNPTPSANFNYFHDIYALS